MLVCRVFPSQTFDINMQIKTAIFIAIAIGCASAENATYVGCYKDEGKIERDLPFFYCSNGKQGGICAADPGIADPKQWWAMSSVMTVATCSGMCKGFKFFGVQDGYSCFCGNSYGIQGGKAPESDCNVPCTGNPIEMCGAGYRNSIYAQPNATTSSH